MQLQDLAGQAQFLDLAFQILDSLCLAGRDAFTHPGVDLIAFDPVQQRLRHAADLGCNRFSGSPNRRVLRGAPAPCVLRAYGLLAQSLAAFNSSPGNPADDAPLSPVGSAPLEVVAFVGVQLCRSFTGTS